MKKEYDLSKMKKVPNPYAKRLKKAITIRIDQNTIEYFKNLATKSEFSYQQLINLYLKDCAHKNRKPMIHWQA